MENNIVKVEKKLKKNRKKLFSFWTVAISVIVALAIGILATLGVLYFGPLGKIMVKLKSIDGIARLNYLGEIDYEKLDQRVLSGYVKGLEDKYGFYSGPEDADGVANSFEGSTYGIGVTVISYEDSLYVYRVDSNSPASKAGIIPGDRIIAIDDKSVKEMGYEKSVQAVKKELGATSNISLLRENKTLAVTVTYEEFIRQTVYTRIINNVGYVCITAFNKATVSQFNADIDMLVSKGVNGIIFDLRDNTGGTLDSVCEMLDRLVGECNLATVEYSDGERVVTHRSDKNEISLKMAAITNENTASAAELFAATIRDMKKGPLIGNTTFGKGVMQTTYFLPDGSCVRLTTGYYYPAGGVCYDKEGLKPDYEVIPTEEEEKNMYFLGDNDPYIKKALEVIEVE